jgi:tetratricopeptide (TPR) repeat protein
MIGRWVAFHARHPEGRAIDRARALLPRNLGEPRDYDSRIAIVARADIERALGDVAAAVRSLRSVLDSFSPDVQSRAAAIGTLTGQAQQDLFREIEPLLYARNNLSMLLLEQGTSLDEALGLVEQCLAIIPGSPELRDTHAQVLLKLGRVSEAEQSSVFAIQRLPTNASVILTGCEILLASGRVEDSRLLVQRVREILAREPWPSREVEDRLRRVASQIDS